MIALLLLPIAAAANLRKNETPSGHLRLEKIATPRNMTDDTCIGTVCSIDRNGFKDSDGLTVPWFAESVENALLERFVDPNASVLEIGAGYGTATCVLARILRNSGRLAAVEADRSAAAALRSNLERNGCRAHVFEGALGRAQQVTYTVGGGRAGPRMVEGEPPLLAWLLRRAVPSFLRAPLLRLAGEEEVPTTTPAELRGTTGVDADTLVAHCNGCFEQFLEDFPAALDRVAVVLLEGDYGVRMQRFGRARYDRVTARLASAGFRLAVERLLQDEPYERDGQVRYYVFQREAAPGQRPTDGPTIDLLTNDRSS